MRWVLYGAEPCFNYPDWPVALVASAVTYVETDKLIRMSNRRSPNAEWARMLGCANGRQRCSVNRSVIAAAEGSARSRDGTGSATGRRAIDKQGAPRVAGRCRAFVTAGDERRAAEPNTPVA